MSLYYYYKEEDRGPKSHQRLIFAAGIVVDMCNSLHLGIWWAIRVYITCTTYMAVSPAKRMWSVTHDVHPMRAYCCYKAGDRGPTLNQRLIFAAGIVVVMCNSLHLGIWWAIRVLYIAVSLSASTVTLSRDINYPFSAETDSRLQNLTSVDVRFWRL